MIWETCVAKKVAADAAIQEVADSITHLNSELNKGVSLGAGKVIIKGIWGETPEAKKLVARLSAAFPKENSDLIRWASLPPYALETITGPTKAAIDYILEVQEFIERMVGKVLAQLSNCDINNEVGIQAANHFRRNVLIYIEAVRYNMFSVSAESAAEKPSWQDYKVESTLVDEGEYLMISDFLPDLKDAHNKLMERRNKDFETEGDTPSFSSLKWNNTSYLAEINVTHLFAEYLNQLVSDLEIALD